jgi:hypothetical protein
MSEGEWEQHMFGREEWSMATTQDNKTLPYKTKKNKDTQLRDETLTEAHNQNQKPHQ